MGTGGIEPLALHLTYSGALVLQTSVRNGPRFEFQMVAPAGFEPALDGLSFRCLCQLGYGATEFQDMTPTGFEPVLDGF